MEAAHVSPELPVRWVVSADRTVEIKEEVTELGCDQANERTLQEETPPSSIAERGADMKVGCFGRQESEMASSRIKEEDSGLEPVPIKKEVAAVHIEEESPVLQPVPIKKEVSALKPVHIKEESPALESAECQHLSEDLQLTELGNSRHCPSPERPQMSASSPQSQDKQDSAGTSSSSLCGRPTASHRGRKRKAVVESELTSYLRESDERYFALQEENLKLARERHRNEMQERRKDREANRQSATLLIGFLSSLATSLGQNLAKN
ncbi:uncharacterized protein LOC121305974 [Polyodon spathula]|uniref:uncharacterized protein LOC121305974 n=1 Tax=Polyodon spathula TaxID=7913 RepID=UPI001B7E05B3|nr:uncharacterized protein LOC121305974 [Polyodon spathula]